VDDANYSDVARGVGVDPMGNVYVAGGFNGEALFGTTTLNSGEYHDFFLAKYDSSGTFLWVRQGLADSGHNEYGTGIAVDAAGNSLAVGYFDGRTVSFGSVTATNAGYTSDAYAAFVVKYNSAGAPQWARGLGGGDTYSTTVGMDAAGNGYVVGGFEGTLRIAGTNLTATTSEDGFLAKFNNAGVLQWARQVKGPSLNGGRLGVDPAGHCFLVGGISSGVLDFGGLRITNTGASGMYLARYDPSGQLQWVRHVQGTGNLIYNEGGCAIDPSGNCYFPGIFTGTATFGGTRITSRGGWDVFVAKYDAAGDFQWVQTAGGNGHDGAFRLVVDGGGSCYVVGWFQDLAVFGTTVLQAQGYWDIFLAKLREPLLFTPPLLVANGYFHGRLTGPVNLNVVLEASSNLSNWTAVATDTLPVGGLPFSVPVGTNRQQFYRARPAP
jgi:hypothetical protein